MKRNWKRGLSALLAIAMLATLLVVPAFAAQDVLDFANITSLSTGSNTSGNFTILLGGDKASLTITTNETEFSDGVKCTNNLEYKGKSNGTDVIQYTISNASESSPVPVKVYWKDNSGGSRGVLGIQEGATASDSISLAAVETSTAASSLYITTYSVTKNGILNIGFQSQKGYIYRVVVGSDEVKYSLTTDSSVENGSFVFTVDGAEVTEAAAGATVTVTAKPADGYKLTDNSKITLSYNSTTSEVENGGTFEMPAFDVTASGTFTEQSNDEKITAAVSAINAALTDYTTVAQADVNTDAAAKTAVETKIGLTEGKVNGVNTSVTISNFNAATAGDESNADGTNGSFTYTVTVTDYTGDAITGSVTITATAKTYTVDEVNAAISAAKTEIKKAGAAPAGSVASGKKVVTAAEMSAIWTALDNAAKISSKSGATSAEYGEQVKALTAATTTFAAAVTAATETGTRTSDGAKVLDAGTVYDTLDSDTTNWNTSSTSNRYEGAKTAALKYGTDEYFTLNIESGTRVDGNRSSDVFTDGTDVTGRFNFNGASSSTTKNISFTVTEGATADVTVWWGGNEKTLSLNKGTTAVTATSGATSGLTKNMTAIANWTGLEAGTYWLGATSGEYIFRVEVVETTQEETMTVTADNVNVQYDGEAHGLTFTVTDSEGSDITDYTVQYKATENGEYSDTPITVTNVGSATVYYKVSKDGYAAVENSATITVTQADAPTITASADQTSLAAAGGDVTVTITGVPAASSAAPAISVSPSVTVGDVTKAEDGTYTATVTLPKNTGTENAVEYTISTTWTDSNYNTATIDNVTVTVAKSGEAFLSATEDAANTKKSVTEGGSLVFAVNANATDTSGAAVTPAYNWTLKDSEDSLGTEATLTIADATVADHNGKTYVCTVTYGELTKTVEFTAEVKEETKTITFTVGAGATLTIKVNNEVKTLDAAGKLVDIAKSAAVTFTVTMDATHELVSVTGATASEGTYTVNADADAVTVTTQAKAPVTHNVTWTASEDWALAAVTNDGDSVATPASPIAVAEGKDLKFKVTVSATGKELDAVTADGETLTADSEGVYTITMGAADVALAVTLKDSSTEPGGDEGETAIINKEGTTYVVDMVDVYTYLKSASLTGWADPDTGNTEGAVAITGQGTEGVFTLYPKTVTGTDNGSKFVDAKVASGDSYTVTKGYNTQTKIVMPTEDDPDSMQSGTVAFTTSGKATVTVLWFRGGTSERHLLITDGTTSLTSTDTSPEKTVQTVLTVPSAGTWYIGGDNGGNVIEWVSVVLDTSSDTPEATKYAVTVDAGTGGTATAVAEAAEGDTVTLTVTPDEGYEVDTITTDDAATTVTDNQFTMPAKAITVTVTFKKTDSGTVEPEPETVDTAALTDAITAAEKTIDVYTVEDDTKVTEVNSGTKFVTKSDKAAYQTAIDAAKAVAEKAENGTATQDEVNAAVAALAEATATFKAAIQTGTKNTGSSTSSATSGRTDSNTTTTTTVTEADGTKVTTTVDRQGNTTVVAEKTDGSKITTVTEADGDVTITAVNAEGKTVADVSIPGTMPTNPQKFVDVPEGHWAEKAINDMAVLGMVKGVNDEDHIYDMVSDVTRGAVATILYRFSSGTAGMTCDFTDVAEGQWFTDAVAWASNAGVVTGYDDGTFQPDGSITREQLAVMIARYAAILGLDTTAGSLSGFTDSDAVQPWAAEGVAWCVSNGIINGRGDGTIDPGAYASRAEAAAMLDRLVELLK